MSTIVLITRYGGLGDLVMLLPTIEALRQKHPDAEMVLRTHVDYVGYIDSLFARVVLDDNRYALYPSDASAAVVPRTRRLQADSEIGRAGDVVHHYDFHGVIERRRDVHGMRAFAEAARVELPADVRPHLSHTVDRDGSLTVQLRNCGDGRDLIVEELSEEIRVHPDVTLVMGRLAPQRFIRTIARARIFAGPDSSGLHLAAALGVPRILGLYHPDYPPAIRAYAGVEAFTDRKQFLEAVHGCI